MPSTPRTHTTAWNDASSSRRPAPPFWPPGSRHHLRPDRHQRHQGRAGRRGRTWHRRGRAGAEGRRLRRADRRRRHRPGDRRARGDAAAGSEKFGARVKVDNAFFGLDAYEKVINSGVDVVLLATPPGFRPPHLTAAVNAGKHVFCEKPCATDSPGVREVHGGAEAGAGEEPGARRRLLLALQQHDPGGGAAGAQRRDRPARGALLDLLHEPGEADAARERASGRHERRRVADPQLVQLHVAVRRQPGRAGRAQRRQDHVGR